MVARLWYLCLALCKLIAVVSSNVDAIDSNDSVESAKRNINNGIQLRVLPLGASIVYGLKSSDGNGFRYGLRNQLVYDGNPVNMIGSVHSGTMADNDCEGWPSYVIDQVAAKAELSIPSQPNLVLLHVGTNDCSQNLDIPNAGSRLGTLIDRLFDAIPGVTIVASTLLPNGNTDTQSNIQTYNTQVTDVIKNRQESGKQVTYVDFSSSYFTLSDIGPDGTHPTDAGYLKMAEVWYQGIQVAADQGWITAPAPILGVNDTVVGSDTTCDKIAGGSVGPTQTQMGSGSDDGAYFHIGKQVLGFQGFANPSGVNFNNSHPEGVFWGDIDGDGIDDYIFVGSNSKYGIGVALSLYGGGLGDYLYSFFSVSCARKGVHFTDMTGDGRDDFCCLGPDGGLECWENTIGNDARSPSWVSMGVVKKSEGYPQAQVRLADIDGDGRTDYVVFDAATTDIFGWRNGALQPGPPQYWYAMHGVFSGLPALDLAGWRFVDLNGDKKDDLIWVSPNGAVTTWINRRGFSVGLGPQWVSHGVTHQGSTYPVNVTFGDFMGSGRADYALVSTKKNLVWIDRWENLDHGGTMVRADGTFYCDMTGSGSDDYVFINATGAITLFENHHNWGYWVPWGIIYNADAPRQQIHLADFDGDGKCDILLVDKNTGLTEMIHNQFANGKFDFEVLGGVNEGATCTEGYGNDKHDRGVRWADIDGDGRADFLCMQTNGVTTGYLNKGINSMIDQGLIKHAEGKERVNLRFADINGDGKDDFLYVNMIDGAVTAWYNGGAIESSGSAFRWNWAGNVSTGGSSRGSCVEFGELYGDGRADYIVVEPATNKAWTWFNLCPDGGLGPTTPDLPTGAPPPPAPLFEVSSGVVITKTTKINSNGQPTTLTGTIVTLSTTDHRGSTVVVKSTAGLGSVITVTESNSAVITTIAQSQPVTTTDSAGITVISNTGGVFTIPSAVSTPLTVTNGDGSVITFDPVTSSRQPSSIASGVPVVTTTNSLGLTIVSESGNEFTIPPGITEATTIQESDGVLVTFFPGYVSLPTSSSTSSSSVLPVGFLFPITDPVPSPKPTDGGTAIPCNLWFFFICLRWGDLDVQGWAFDLPPGVYPPGPPPPITIDPDLSITFSVKGTLPPWPRLTIGSDRLPTYSPEPTSCDTETAALCATSTSYSVSLSGSSTITTGSQVASTCATIYGCKVEDSSTATTTTSGCTSAGTATDYWVSCSTTAFGASTCSTTSSSTTTGCSVTPTTVTCGVLSPTGTIPDPACSDDVYSYIVWPKDGTNADQVSTIQNALLKYVDDPSKLYTSTANGLGTNYWRLPLFYNQSYEVASLSNVASVNDDCGESCPDPTTANNYQDIDFDIWRSWQLSYVSWPRGYATNPFPDRYHFDSSAGSGVDVYIADTGAKISHPEFQDLQARVRWLPSGTVQDDAGSHGTVMLSLVAGQRSGVAKNINPIVARAPVKTFSFAQWIDLISVISDDILFDSEAATGILLMSVHFDRQRFTLNQQHTAAQADSFEARAYLLLNALVRKGLVPITGSGNPGKVGEGVPSDGWPANFGKKSNQFYIPALMVLGAINVNGENGYVYSKADLPNGIPHFWAPGHDVPVAEAQESVWGSPPRLQKLYRLSQGTSCAAAVTAGLAAYFLKLISLGILRDSDNNLVGNTPQAITDFITNTNEVIWPRSQSAGQVFPGIWNRADLSQQFCPWVPGNPPSRKLAMRQETSSSASCYIPEPTSSSPPILSSSSTSALSASLPATATVTLPVPSPTLNYNLFSDGNCQNLYTSITLDTFNACIVPQPDGGWLSMQLASHEGIESNDNTTILVSGVENSCSVSQESFSFSDSISSCINAWASEASTLCEEGTINCFTAVAVTWISD